MRIALVLFALSLSACAAAPQLEDYPRSPLDRPYALPKGLAQWEIWGLLVGTKTDPAAAAWPFFWRTVLTERLNLLLMPIPVALDWELGHDAGGATTGLTLSWGIGYGSTTGFVFNPTLQGYRRWRLAPQWALAARAGASAGFGDVTTPLRVGVAIEPWWQPSPQVAWGLRFGVAGGPGRPSAFLGDLGVESGADPVPLFGALALANLSRQWDLGVEALMQPGPSFTRGVLVVRAIHTW